MMQTTRQRKLFQTTSLVCIRFLCLAGVIIGQILQFTDPLIGISPDNIELMKTNYFHSFENQ